MKRVVHLQRTVRRDHPEPVKHRGILPHGQLTSSRDERPERLRDPGRAANDGRLLSEVHQ